MGKARLGRWLGTKCSWHHEIERNCTSPTRFSFLLHWLSAQPIKMCKKNCVQSALTPLPPLRPGLEMQWIFGGKGDSAYSTQFAEFTVILGGMTETHAHSFCETKIIDCETFSSLDNLYFFKLYFSVLFQVIEVRLQSLSWIVFPEVNLPPSRELGDLYVQPSSIRAAGIFGSDHKPCNTRLRMALFCLLSSHGKETDKSAQCVWIGCRIPYGNNLCILYAVRSNSDLRE